MSRCGNVETDFTDNDNKGPLTQRRGLEIAEWQVFLNLGIPHHHLTVEDETAFVKMVKSGNEPH